MNANLIGADPTALRNMASSFRQTAGELEAIRTRVGSLLNDFPGWRGSDIGQFRQQWSSGGGSHVQRAATSLHETAKMLTHNAADQERASASLDRVSGTSAPSFGKSAGSLSGLINTGTADGPQDKDGFRIDTVVGSDGKTRYIVYIDGTNAGTDGGLVGAVQGLNPFRHHDGEPPP